MSRVRLSVVIGIESDRDRGLVGFTFSRERVDERVRLVGAAAEPADQVFLALDLDLPAGVQLPRWRGEIGEQARIRRERQALAGRGVERLAQRPIRLSSLVHKTQLL